MDLREIFDASTVDVTLWDRLDSMDDGCRVDVPLTVMDLKQVRDSIRSKKPTPLLAELKDLIFAAEVCDGSERPTDDDVERLLNSIRAARVAVNKVEGRGRRHTPGPWTAAKAGDKTGWRVFSLSDAAIAPAIAYGDTDEQAMANATLIAEAPSLLLACKNALSQFEHNGDECDYDKIVLDELHAIIVKAEGRAG